MSPLTQMRYSLTKYVEILSRRAPTTGSAFTNATRLWLAPPNISEETITTLYAPEMNA